ncbi:MAG: Gfo/Idh/MocA family oxidoreductase [Longimonas sp.]|uniref:NAD(P)H-dependent oxidoreductase n=1 Tax=Longimonas sp. TaxID=2039626 RepID=UPI00335DA547
MIIVDTALQQREADNNPIRVALVGAGYQGRGVALQICTAITGMRLVAISNRTLPRAEAAYAEAGIDDVTHVRTVSALEEAIAADRFAVTEDAELLCRAEGIDAIIEATGTFEFGAQVALAAIENGKHLILSNAELDATLGPILNVYAEQAGVVLTDIDGDQPGSMMNLYRFVDAIGYRPVLVGNIKGLLDHYRTPETQRAWAEKHGQAPYMVTSFADGTKISMENAVAANATGFPVGQRGMYGPRCAHVTEAVDLFPKDELLDTGLNDYVIGAEPGPGVFVIAYNDHPVKRQYTSVLKMGDGPFYVFYTPYHLPHLEVPLTVARAVCFGDATVAPLGPPVCHVLALAKRDLKQGETLDGLGGFCTYGWIDNADVTYRDNLLPLGLSEGATLLRDIPRDQALTFDDVLLPEGRLIDRLWAEQTAHFGMAPVRATA